MIYLSLSLFLIVTEILLYKVWVKLHDKPIKDVDKIDLITDISNLNYKIEELEKSVDALKVSQSMRRKE